MMSAGAFLLAVALIAGAFALGAMGLYVASELTARVQRWRRRRTERRAKAATVNEWMREQRGKQ